MNKEFGGKGDTRMTSPRNLRVLREASLLISILSLSFPVCANYSGGSGTAEDPYQIATPEDLMVLGDTPEDYDKHFELTADIDLSEYFYDKAVIAADTNDATLEFDGIPFTGVFDGNSFKIRHLFLSGNRYLGLFGNIDSEAVVENLGIIDVKLGGSGQYSGGLAGYNKGRITNCYSMMNQVSEESLSSSRGGLVGYNAHEGTIADCYSNSSLAGSRSVGGLVGTNYGRITGCYSTGNVHGGQSIGGLVGDNKGTIRDCYSTAQFCQWAGAPPTVIWPYCFGGLAGRNSGVIANCYSTGGSWPGLLVPIDPNKPIWPTWPILQLERLGGLVGTNNNGHVIESFWDIQTSRLSESEGGVGLTTLEMKTADTFLGAGWDFMHEVENGAEDMWWILEGRSYPRLRRQYGLAFSHYPRNIAIGYIQDINEPVVIVQPVGIVQPVILSWLPGGSGLYHDVYFGEDEKAVTDATTESPDIYRGRQPPEMTTYDPGALELVKTYYWRIDEVNILDPNGLWKGNVGCFTTANFLAVDDFESYNDIPAWEEGSNLIYETWLVFDNLPPNGAIIGYVVSPDGGPESTMETVIVHGGNQSAPMLYWNTGAFLLSEVVRAFTPAQDWIGTGATVLSLWFYGDPANTPGQLYVKINNVRVDYDGPATNLSRALWRRWTIDLTKVGANLQRVNELAIGIDGSDAKGLLLLDDIELYTLAPNESSYYDLR